MDQIHKTKMLDMDIKFFELQIKKKEAKIESLKNLKVALENYKILLKQAKQLRNEFEGRPVAINLEYVKTSLNELEEMENDMLKFVDCLQVYKRELSKTAIDDRRTKLIHIQKTLKSKINQLKIVEENILFSLRLAEHDIKSVKMTKEEETSLKEKEANIRKNVKSNVKIVDDEYKAFFSLYDMEIRNLLELVHYKGVVLDTERDREKIIVSGIETIKKHLDLLIKTKESVFKILKKTDKVPYQDESHKFAADIMEIVIEEINFLEKHVEEDKNGERNGQQNKQRKQKRNRQQKRHQNEQQSVQKNCTTR